jgi:hypothetical protein
VTGRDPSAPAVVESYVDLVLGLLFPGAPSRAPKGLQTL